MKRRYRKQKTTIILFAAAFVCFLSVGYAAFSQSFLLSGKGTIVVPKETITTTQLTENIVTTGDGLYEDTTEEGRYIYRGTEPSNYITFNGEEAGWRIMSVESDGTIKIIRNESIGDMSWDSKETRDTTTSTYCTYASSYGCNAWAATENLVDTPSEFTLYNPNGNPDVDTTTYSGTVTEDASLNTYLNTTYLGTINDDSGHIVDHNFNVGTPGNNLDTEDIATDVDQEALYKWNGKVGLMNMTDVLKTTTNTACTSLKSAYSNSAVGNCNTNNWMWAKTGYELTISPYVNATRFTVWRVSGDGFATNNIANTTSGVRPVVYLSSDIELDGSGTSDKPYTIVEE